MVQPAKSATPADLLAGLVDRVTFHNAENGFCVLRVKERGQRDLITLVGHAAMISAGEFVQASGSWINDRSHGVQFRASFPEGERYFSMPSTVVGARVVMSGAFATREVIPRLPAFLDQHPRLKIELRISDRTDDLVAEGVDLALRMGPLAASAFGARLLASAPRLVIASPAYLSRHGIPETLADLSTHDCIVGPGVTGRSGWRFR